MSWLLLIAVSAYILLSGAAVRECATPPEREPMQPKKQDDAPVPTDTIEYCNGQAAYLEGEPVDACPYNKHDGRTGWLTGWYNAKLNSRLGHVFERHGVGPL